MKHSMRHRPHRLLENRYSLPGIGLLLLFVLVTVSRHGAADPLEFRPTVVLMTTQNTPEIDEQYRSIRAQLAGTPIHLVRYDIDPSLNTEQDRRRAATQVAMSMNAGLVFWIDDGEIVRTYYLIPGTGEGRIIKKDFPVAAAPQSSRRELIAVATAGMVEKLYVSRQIAAPPKDVATPSPKPTSPPPPKPIPRKAEKPIAEISAAYAGLFFAENTFVHGARLGAAFYPVHHFAFGVAFSQIIPTAIHSDQLTLTLTSRLVEITIAARWTKASFDFRLGAAVLSDIRSFSAESSDSIFYDIRNGRQTVVSIMPFFSIDWNFAGRLGLFATLGAGMALNETRYEFSIDNAVTSVLAPFFVKLQLFGGLVIKI